MKHDQTFNPQTTADGEEIKEEEGLDSLDGSFEERTFRPYIKTMVEMRDSALKMQCPPKLDSYIHSRFVELAPAEDVSTPSSEIRYGQIVNFCNLADAINEIEHDYNNFESDNKQVATIKPA